MEKVISIGKQNFASLRENHYFFVDKSHFIKDWWENGDHLDHPPPPLWQDTEYEHAGLLFL